MNHRLRRRHRVAAVLLAVVLPWVLYWAARTRRPAPVMEHLPGPAAGEAAGR